MVVVILKSELPQPANLLPWLLTYSRGYITNLELLRYLMAEAWAKIRRQEASNSAQMVPRQKLGPSA